MSERDPRLGHMPELPARFRPPTTPQADPAAIVAGEHYRITVLTSRLFRLEYSPSGHFEDRATQTVVNRRLPVPSFEVLEGERLLEIVTDHAHLRYDRGPFATNGLSIAPRGSVINYGGIWRYGEPAPRSHYGFPVNMGGTARTLDEADGAVPLEDGLMSMRGYAVLDDSASIALTDDGWVAEREPGAIDLYYFGYGADFAGCLADFYRISGPQPLLPRYALGNWWSRYHRYSADEYLMLMDRFAERSVPFSVAVIDMDWHLVDDVPERYGSGWTGYTWNRRLFPDPPAFLAALHRRGMKVTLNVHPADGVRPFEEAYPAVAKALGIDPASDLPVPFDIADPGFLTAYFDLVHHPLEDDGVDFWWIDWQQGGVTSIRGLDPLWMLNHFHFLDAARRGERPLTFSRYAGPGSHRYPVGFSGDTVVSWASLEFQPRFTATASNIGYGWWSHDIGGHMMGRRDDELEARWLQLGAFSPVNRLHSSNSEFGGKEPWRYDAISAGVQEEFLRLRHRLVPYLYTMNERAHREGVPLVTPIYYRKVDVDTVRLLNEFSFGSELVVAPITSPRVASTRLASARGWLPPGVWIDFFTGLAYDGDRIVDFHRGLAEYPVLAQAGAIVPLTGPDDLRADVNPQTLEVRVFAGADGRFVLYEDDGAAGPRSVRTPLAFEWASGRFTVGPAQGASELVPAGRRISVVFVGLERFDAPQGRWDADGRLVVDLGEVSADAGAEVVLGAGLRLAENDVVGRVYRLLEAAQVELVTKERVYDAVRGHDDPAARARAVEVSGADADLVAAVQEIVFARV